MNTHDLKQNEKNVSTQYPHELIKAQIMYPTNINMT
jgi:hypothetical protein